MGKVPRSTATGSVMSAAYGSSARRTRNSNQLDFFSSLFIDPAETVAPAESQPEQTKVEDGREKPIAGYDSQPLAALPAPDGRGAAQEEPAGGGDKASGGTHVGSSLRTAVYKEDAISGRLGTGDTGMGVAADRGPPLALLPFDPD